MLARLDPRQYPSIKEAGRDLIAQYPLINAVVSGTQNGHVYADRSGGCYFIATKSGFSLFHAADPAPGSDAAFFDFLRHNHDIPNYIHIYAPRHSFADYIAANWDKYRIRRRAQFRYFRNDTSYERDRPLPAGFRIAAVQQADFDRLEQAFKLDLGARFWNSKEDFLANAIGACILAADDEPAAICYSACIVDGIAEVDVLVSADHRGKRFARFVSEPFVELAVSKALTPHWDAFVANTPSYLMAQKLGMKPMQEYDLLSLLLR
jgi:GNAT acetyltransferase-like protein